MKHREQKILKTITIIVLIYSGFQALTSLVNVLTIVYNTTNSNPLVPEYLYKYAAFPHIILFTLFLIIFIHSNWSLKKTIFNSYLIVLISAIIVFKLVFYKTFFNLINHLNPFNS